MGLAIGTVIRANAQQPRMLIGMILFLILSEAFGFYGLITGLVVAATDGSGNFDRCQMTMRFTDSSACAETDSVSAVGNMHATSQRVILSVAGGVLKKLGSSGDEFKSGTWRKRLCSRHRGHQRPNDRWSHGIHFPSFLLKTTLWRPLHSTIFLISTNGTPDSCKSVLLLVSWNVQ